MRNLICDTTYRTHNNDFLDGSIYPEQTYRRGRAVKHKPSSEAQQRLNEDNARRHALRLVQDNFRSGVDFIVHPTYDKNNLPSDDERQKKDLRNFMNRVKRLYKKLGINEEFKYWGATVGGSRSRRHFHYIITASRYPNLADMIRELWPFGTCNVDRLIADKEQGFADIVNYICNNVFECGERIHTKRWCASRNLKQPEARQRRGAISNIFLTKLANSPEYERAVLLESRFPGYKAVEIDVSEIKDAPEDRKHRIFGKYYVYFRMRKLTAKEIQAHANARLAKMKKEASNE